MAIITFGGDLGAGKTTVAKRLADALGYEELYVGNVFRELAREQGISIEKFYADLKNNPELEKLVDARQLKLMCEKDNLVVQGRIAWFFAKQSPFRVINFFLAVNTWIGAQRQKERPEYIGKTYEEVYRLSYARQAEERERYKLLYGIEDYLDRHHYDFLIETSRMNANEVFEYVLTLTNLVLKK